MRLINRVAVQSIPRRVVRCKLQAATNIAHLIDRRRLEILTCLKTPGLADQIGKTLQRHFGELPIEKPFLIEVFATFTIRAQIDKRAPLSLRFSLYPMSALRGEDGPDRLGFFLQKRFFFTGGKLKPNPAQPFITAGEKALPEISAAVLGVNYLKFHIEGTQSLLQHHDVEKTMVFSQYLYKIEEQPTPPANGE